MQTSGNTCLSWKSTPDRKKWSVLVQAHFYQILTFKFVNLNSEAVPFVTLCRTKSEVPCIYWQWQLVLAGFGTVNHPSKYLWDKYVKKELCITLRKRIILKKDLLRKANGTSKSFDIREYIQPKKSPVRSTKQGKTVGSVVLLDKTVRVSNSLLMRLLLTVFLQYKSYHFFTIFIPIILPIFSIKRVIQLEIFYPFPSLAWYASLSGETTCLNCFSDVNLKPFSVTFSLKWTPTVASFIIEATISRPGRRPISGWCCHLTIKDDTGSCNTNRITKAICKNWFDTKNWWADQFKASTFPRANHGHLTVVPARGMGNLNLA